MNTSNLKWLKDLLDLFFPHFCAGCRRPDFILCPDCKQKIKPEPFNLYPGADLACFSYTDPAIRQLITDLKFRQIKETANILADLMIPLVDDLIDQLNWSEILITAVPLSKKRKFQRGYNQAELIARHLSQKIKVKNKTDFTILKRIKTTRPQTKLKGRDRRLNLQNAFACIKTLTPETKLIVIDDVATSGATAAEVRKAIKQKFKGRLLIITVAHSS
ncbi:MAG: ComF family protein [Patescibacteria group bacterium]